MRVIHNAQASIFENYSEHEFGVRLKALSAILDQHSEILTLVEADLIDTSLTPIGCRGLTVESNIATPSDSQLLNDGIRVLSRLMTKNQSSTNVKLKFTGKRKASKSLQAMGVKEKTFKQLRNFRADVERKISELKRVFGANKAKWKNADGFAAFLWSAVLSYNLVRLARQNTT